MHRLIVVLLSCYDVASIIIFHCTDWLLYFFYWYRVFFNEAICQRYCCLYFIISGCIPPPASQSIVLLIVGLCGPLWPSSFCLEVTNQPITSFHYWAASLWLWPMWQLIDTASKAADTGDIRDGVVRVSDGHRAARYSEAAGHDGRRCVEEATAMCVCGR